MTAKRGASGAGPGHQDGDVRMRSNRDFDADVGAATVLVVCRHCGNRFLRTSPAAAKAVILAHLLAAHPGQHKASAIRRQRGRRS